MLAGISFVLHHYLLKGDFKKVLHNEALRFCFAIEPDASYTYS